MAEVARAARDAPRPNEDEVVAGDLLLDALVALIDDHDHDRAAPRSRSALRRLAARPLAPADRLRWLWHGTVIAFELWDDESAYALSRNHVRAARNAGALSELALALSSHPSILVFCGELAAAASLVAEAQSVTDATGIHTAPYGELKVAAWQGREGEARKLIETATREAETRGEGIGVAVCQYTRALLCNSLGQYEEGRLAATAAAEHRELVVENWALPELIESASRTGRTDLATDAMDRLATKARMSGTDWVLGVEARSRALLSGGDRAEELYREALARLSRTRVRAELARTHLLYGEWLRRAGRRVDARAALNRAHAAFTDWGMDGFAERTRRELTAAGATVRKRDVDAGDDLTAQEAQIAHLARDGLTNLEIGAQLFISARTVEWHLRNVFNKLGISRRGQLGSALPGDRHTAL